MMQCGQRMKYVATYASDDGRTVRTEVVQTPDAPRYYDCAAGRLPLRLVAHVPQSDEGVPPNRLDRLAAISAMPVRLAAYGKAGVGR